MNSRTQFHVMSGRRVVATRTGPSAREVALEYVRSMGCKRDEIVYYGHDGVSWRGAVYRAQHVEPVARPTELVELPPVSPPYLEASARECSSSRRSLRRLAST